MATATQTMADGRAVDSTPTATTTEGRLATAMLSHARASYSFAFTPFLQTTYHHGLPADRPICKAYSAGHCPLGTRCPDRHMSNGSGGRDREGGGGGGGGFNSLVCKHWLRGLCKKGEGCEFLHEYNLRKMPECNFFLRNGYCSNGDECLYLHIDPRSKLPPCPDYDDRGFCVLGPACPKKHVRRTLCPCYLAGFCPDGRACKAGAHPHWSSVAVVPASAAGLAAAAAAAQAAADAAAAQAAQDAADQAAGRGGGGGPDFDRDTPMDDDSGVDDDRGGGERSWDHRGGYKDKFGRGGGRGGGGGGWRGRGTGGGHKFRGRGY